MQINLFRPKSLRLLIFSIDFVLIFWIVKNFNGICQDNILYIRELCYLPLNLKLIETKLLKMRSTRLEFRSY